MYSESDVGEQIFVEQILGNKVWWTNFGATFWAHILGYKIWGTQFWVQSFGYKIVSTNFGDQFLGTNFGVLKLCIFDIMKYFLMLWRTF